MTKTVDILVANGVNLDLLGQRESSHYGSFDLNDLEAHLRGEAQHLAAHFNLASINLHFFQSNVESAFMEALTATTFDGALINPAAWTHTSLALADRIATLTKPFIEVHISNLAKRDPMRQKSFTAPYAAGVVYGLGVDSYSAGLYGLLRKIVGVAR